MRLKQWGQSRQSFCDSHRDLGTLGPWIKDGEGDGDVDQGQAEAARATVECRAVLREKVR